MVIYEITTNVDPALVAEFERYMADLHIPALMASGYFVSATLSRTGDTFQIRYTAADRASLDAYLNEHAERLRADVAKRFASGVHSKRQIWDVLAEFPSP